MRKSAKQFSLAFLLGGMTLTGVMLAYASYVGWKQIAIAFAPPLAIAAGINVFLAPIQETKPPSRGTIAVLSLAIGYLIWLPILYALLFHK